MRVDAQRIRTERERRAWTQAQLAGATALGLRTVQRIEREGSASFESAQAIAAALELSIDDLRIETSTETDTRKPGYSFLLRLVFAALSGAAVNAWVEWPHGLMANRDPLWDPLSYLVPGCLFAVSVLVPELPAGRTFVRRALALILASALSFFIAVKTAVDGPAWLGSGFTPTLPSLLAASVAGAGVVLLAAHCLIGMDRPARLWIGGLIAAVLGAVAIHVMHNTSMLPHRTFFEYASFAIWHLLLCVSIRIGRGMGMPFPSTRPLIPSARALLPGGKLWRLRAQPI